MGRWLLLSLLALLPACSLFVDLDGIGGGTSDVSKTGADGAVPLAADASDRGSADGGTDATSSGGGACAGHLFCATFDGAEPAVGFDNASFSGGSMTIEGGALRVASSEETGPSLQKSFDVAARTITARARFARDRLNTDGWTIYFVLAVETDAGEFAVSMQFLEGQPHIYVRKYEPYDQASVSAGALLGASGVFTDVSVEVVMSAAGAPVTRAFVDGTEVARSTFGYPGLAKRFTLTLGIPDQYFNGTAVSNVMRFDDVIVDAVAP
ncbi:MAG: hypothetical protein U0270_39330 [Labilithrix sp.]